MTGTLPSSVPVPSRKTSKRRGYEGTPLTKYHHGVALEEKDCLTTKNYAKKIRNYFEKYHLGVGAVYIIFSDCLNYDLYFKHCDSLFAECVTETEYIHTLHDSLRVFYGSYATSADGVASKNRWIEEPSLFTSQLKFKFGKPGVMSLEQYEQVVASDFETLMNDREKKTDGKYTNFDNAILIRFRIQCFHHQKHAHSKTTNDGNKKKRYWLPLAAIHNPNKRGWHWNPHFQKKAQAS